MAGAMAVLLAAALGVSLFGMLDPLALFYSFCNAFRFPLSPLALGPLSGLLLVVGASLLVPQVWCRKLCPLGGLQDMATWLRRFGSQRRDKATAFQPARRVALGALGGAGFGLLFRQTATATGASLRPPGSLAADEFLGACIRCGNCAKVCPTGIIQSTLAFSNLSSWMTPHLSFAAGYCLPECTACGRACPSGAIRRFAREQKKALVIGVARIRIEDCLLSEQKECDRCRFYCTYDAVSIRTSDIDFNAWPEIHEEKCVGCGACVAACPARVITVEQTTRTLSNDASN
jgi:ferredoxin-type protein NapF